MKAKASIKTPQQYLNSLEEPRKSELKKLHQLIRKTAPSFKPYIQSGMIGYGKFTYSSASVKEGTWFRIGLASQKNYISLYFCATSDGQYVAEARKKDMPQASVGKSCVRIKNLEALPIPILKNLIKETVKIAKNKDTM